MRSENMAWGSTAPPRRWRARTHTLSRPASAPRSLQLGGTERRRRTSARSRERWRASSATSQVRFSRASDERCSAATARSCRSAGQLTQIIPAIETGVVSVVEHDLDRVIANRLDRDDGDVLLARDNLFLARRVALHFSAWALHA